MESRELLHTGRPLDDLDTVDRDPLLPQVATAVLEVGEVLGTGPGPGMKAGRNMGIKAEGGLADWYGGFTNTDQSRHRGMGRHQLEFHRSHHLVATIPLPSPLTEQHMSTKSSGRDKQLVDIRLLGDVVDDEVRSGGWQESLSLHEARVSGQTQ